MVLQDHLDEGLDVEMMRVWVQHFHRDEKNGDTEDVKSTRKTNTGHKLV